MRHGHGITSNERKMEVLAESGFVSGYSELDTCGVSVCWIRGYRLLRHPVNLRLAQAENQNVSTLFRG